MNALTAKIETLETAQIIEIAKTLVANTGDAETVVFEHALTVLESRLEDSDYCDLMEELYAAL